MGNSQVSTSFQDSGGIPDQHDSSVKKPETDLNRSKRVNILTVCLSVSVAVGASEYQSVTAKVGEDVTLDIEDTHLQPEDDLIWSYGPNHTVFITFCNGDLQRIFPDRFQLDQRTGSLTIRSPTVEDARLYECVISNDRGPTWRFNLTVVADPTSTPPGPPHDRTHWIVGVSGFIFICILLLFAWKRKEATGKCCSHPPAVV
ncbi:uncharacterized protein LOC110970630 isoform X2 [Acanthochromis polyacanthus]|uniref:uncharacterized protein LOC110970630 isoform X2 n=1 Tax=Acanthochromis polyacanthus TaxID=80966 RepID=UPI002233F203|nr:uncharacterized protein LOC110970630 isoform X2 [Acanthochromis polyacanthus]